MEREIRRERGRDRIEMMTEREGDTELEGETARDRERGIETIKDRPLSNENETHRQSWRGKQGRTRVLRLFCCGRVTLIGFVYSQSRRCLLSPPASGPCLPRTPQLLWGLCPLRGGPWGLGRLAAEKRPPLGAWELLCLWAIGFRGLAVAAEGGKAPAFRFEWRSR